VNNTQSTYQDWGRTVQEFKHRTRLAEWGD
jgi:hypothetical protein